MARVNPRTELRSGPAAVSGTSSVSLSGSGALSGASAAVAGIAERVLKGTGAPASAAASASGSGTVGEASLLQDWINRSTGAGVTTAIRFASDDDVTDYQHGYGTINESPNVARNPTGGRLGDGCLQMSVGTSSGPSQYVSWRHPIDPTWTLVSQGIGSSERYIQFQFKPNQYWLQESTDGGGPKICNIAGWNPENPASSLSFTDHEVVLVDTLFRQFLQAYTRAPGGAVNPLYIPFGGSNYRLQSALDRGAELPDDDRYCLYNGGSNSPGCYYFEADYWYTILVRLKLTTYGGSSGNEFDMWIAREDEPDYTKLFENRDFAIDSDSTYTGGPNGIWFLPYDTGRTGHPGGTVVAEYDQLICGTQWIPPPLVAGAIGGTGALSSQASTVAGTAERLVSGSGGPSSAASTTAGSGSVSSSGTPTWLASMTEKTWATPVSNTLDDVKAAGIGGASGFPDLIDGWSGGAACEIRSSLLVHGGGHAGLDDNSVYEVRFDADAPAWARRYTFAGSRNDRTYADGSPSASHTASHLVTIPGVSKLYMVSHSFTWQTANPFPNTWENDIAAGTWTDRGSFGTGSNYANGSQGVTVYDPVDELFWFTNQYGGLVWVDPSDWTTDLAWDSTFHSATGMALEMDGSLWPSARCLAMYRSISNELWLMDLDNIAAGWTAKTPTGAPTFARAAGVTWHEPSKAFLIWGHSSNRDYLYKLEPPTDTPSSFSDLTSGTWTITAVTPHASNSITPDSPTTLGTYKRATVHKDVNGSGIDVFAVVNDVTSDVYVYRLPAGGV